MGNKLHYEPPGKCSMLRSGGGTSELKEVRSDEDIPQARENIICVFSSSW